MRRKKDPIQKIIHVEEQIERETEADLNADLTNTGVLRDILTALREILAELRAHPRLSQSSAVQFTDPK